MRRIRKTEEAKEAAEKAIDEAASARWVSDEVAQAKEVACAEAVARAKAAEERVEQAEQRAKEAEKGREIAEKAREEAASMQWLSQEVAQATEVAYSQAFARIQAAEAQAEEAEQQMHEAEKGTLNAETKLHQLEAQLRAEARLRAEEGRKHDTEIERLKGELSRAHKAVQDTLIAASERVDVARRERDGARADASVAESQLLYTMREAEKVRQQMGATKARMEHLGKERDLLDQKMQLTETELQQLEEEHKLEQASYGEKDQLVRSELERLKVQLDGSRAEVGQERQLVARLGQQLEEVRGQLMEAREQLEAEGASGVKDELKMKAAEAHQELLVAQTALVDAKKKGRAERDKLRSQLMAAETELRGLGIATPLSPARRSQRSMAVSAPWDAVPHLKVEEKATSSVLATLQLTVVQNARSALPCGEGKSTKAHTHLNMLHECAMQGVSKCMEDAWDPIIHSSMQVQAAE